MEDYIALSDRFCATRSLLLEEGGRPRYTMYPQRLMVLQKYVLSAICIGHDTAKDFGTPSHKMSKFLT